MDPPDTAFFKGSIAGDPASSVLLSVRADGTVGGLAYRGNASFALGRASPSLQAGGGGAAAAAVDGGGAAPAGPLASRKATSAQMDALPPFECGVKRSQPITGAAALTAAAHGARKLSQVSAHGA